MGAEWGRTSQESCAEGRVNACVGPGPVLQSALSPHPPLNPSAILHLWICGTYHGLPSTRVSLLITMKVKPLCPRMVLYTLNSSPHLNPTTSYSDKCHHCPFIDELPET